MKNIKIHILFITSIFSFFSCQDASKEEGEGARGSINSYSEESDNYSGVWVSDHSRQLSFNSFICSGLKENNCVF